MKKPFPVIDIPRIWPQGTRGEDVQGLGNRWWQIQDLRNAVAEEPVYDVPLAFLDLSNQKFGDEGGLIEFAQHMKHVNEADLSHPIIFDQWGQILDGRHRIVKALLAGHATIRAVKLPEDAFPTYRA